MDIKNIKISLEKEIDQEIVDEIFDEFSKLKTAHFSKDKIKTGIFSGRFCEVIVAAIKNHYTKKKIDLNKINFDGFCNEIINYSKPDAKDELLSLNIPLVAKAVYSLRSKKKIAHIKSFDPNFFDIDYVYLSCKWILAQLILLFAKIDENDLYNIIESIMEKEIPFIQEFEDGSCLVLIENIDFKDELILTLYKISKRVSNEQLKSIIKSKYSSKVTTYLSLLEKKRFVHRNNEGNIITELGIRYVENNLMGK
jgi:hypothetical protein